MRRTALKALATLVILIGLAAAGLYVYLRRSLPAIDGTIRLAGLSAPVDIIRDADDIPHVFASTKADALFGLGYVHAQDRLWQMEFQRRIGNGRLCEIFGDATLAEDRFLRTVGFGRAAQSAWDHLPPDARAQIDAYVAGVNAFISTHHGSQLPPEFTLLRFEPEPWTGEDVIVWVKMMAWDLSANYSFELMRHDIESRVGRDRMAALLPPYPGHGLSILDGVAPADGETKDTASRRPARQSTNARGNGTAAGSPAAVGAPGRAIALSTPTSSWSDAFDQVLGPRDSIVADFLRAARIEALGSNNWVVDGTMTASGKPLLANDPHLATHMPSLWYLAHVTAGDFDIAGATLPGAPAVAIGRNRNIAWGETNVAADVEDLYLEKLNEAGTAARFKDVDEPLRIVKETIKIKGGDPLTIDVRITRHGPLVSDALNANTAASKTEPKSPLREPLAFRWTALDDTDTTVVAFLKLNEAHNWSEFTAALRDFVVPSQNFVYADVQGHIGYYAPGHIPVRSNAAAGAAAASGATAVSAAPAHDGSEPVEGWTGESEWNGWIPFEDLPHAFDPSSHFIVTANNRPEPAGYPFQIAIEYPNPYRAERITSLLQQRTRLTPSDFQAIQADTFSLHAKELLPILLPHAHPTGATAASAFEALKRWDFNASGESAGAAIFNAWFVNLAPAIVGDELGPSALNAYRGRFSYVTRFVSGLLRGDIAPAWCDDVRTPQQETCDDVVTAAFEAGVASLATPLGSDPARWRWDRVHRAVFPHQGLDSVPVLHMLLSRSVPNGGDWSTVNVGPVDVDHPYDQISVPGYRQIIDLSPANDSRFLEAGGQSGHFLSSRYDDFLDDWHDVRSRPMRMSRADAERGAIGRLRLEPR